MKNREYTLEELMYRGDLRARRADLLMETLDLAMRGYPEDYAKIDELDVEINAITAELKSRVKEENALADLMQTNNVTVEEIQQAVASRGYYSAATPIEKYDSDFIRSVLIGAWPQVYKMIQKIRKTKIIAPNFGETKVFCPDCGTELQTYIHRQMVEPFNSYVYFNCPGCCHVEACISEGLDPKRLHNGVPKFYIPLGNGLIDIDKIISTVNATIELEGRLQA